jgi:hypothetical protein
MELLEARVEGHVVDARALVADVLVVLAEILRELEGRALHRMAEPDMADVGRELRQRPAVDRHRVHILKHQRVGAELAHVLRDVEKHGHGAQAPHDAADAERVGDGLAQAVSLRDLEIGDGAGLVARHLDHDDDEVGARERLAPVGRRGDDGRDGERVGDLLRDDARRPEPLLVDVVKRDLAICEDIVEQDVADEVLHEDRAAGADQRDFRHLPYSPQATIVAAGPQCAGVSGATMVGSQAMRS